MKRITCNVKYKINKKNILKFFGCALHASRFTFHERGFSLIELIIYIGILTAISGVFVAIIFNLNLSSTRSKVETEVQQNIRLAMQSISQTLRSSQQVSVPSAGSSGVTLTAVSQGQSIQYATTSAGVLQKITAGSAPVNITSDKVFVTNLNFTVLENSATTTSSVVTATATSTRFAITVQYNSSNAQFSYTQSATSTEIIANRL